MVLRYVVQHKLRATGTGVTLDFRFQGWEVGLLNRALALMCCFLWLGRCRFLKAMILYDTRAEAGPGSFINGLAAAAAE